MWGMDIGNSSQSIHRCTDCRDGQQQASCVYISLSFLVFLWTKGSLSCGFSIRSTEMAVPTLTLIKTVYWD